MTQAVNYQLAPLQGSSYTVACFEEIKYGAEKLPDRICLTLWMACFIPC